MTLVQVFETIWESFQSKDSVLQPMWDYVRLNHSETLRSPLFPVILTVASYFVLCLPYLVCDIMAVAQWIWRPPVPLPEQAPTLLELAGGVTGSLLLFDLQYFIWHFLHHKIRWLYVTFHAIHHNYSAPFALATQCLSGWELVTVGFWTTLNPILLRCHLLTTWMFMVVHVYVSVEDHCGYDFPWSTSRLIPFGVYGGPSKHDVHHQKPNTNFAPHFSHWDKLFGTHADFSFAKTQ
ncbi:cholesterol 25-hydroxylase-like protein 1, member 2 isoform X2 [Onychostoma macrolepis]|uniref:cholesterol 25-hydroxylase-like protein 1, member 2 isoform X2 n=1 Tax=Onychostoma macrolepis TaxID=369639 RepID=UPI00272C38DE|nr:cholesterol 25-hydroxylase-like protein 1, member 2 isoform X2 [Onychostoma macrolepis]